MRLRSVGVVAYPSVTTCGCDSSPFKGANFSSLKGRGDREAVGGYNASQTLDFAFCIHLKGERAMRTPTTWYATQGVPYAIHYYNKIIIIGITRRDTLSPRQQTKKVTGNYPRDLNCELRIVNCEL